MLNNSQSLYSFDPFFFFLREEIRSRNLEFTVDDISKRIEEALVTVFKNHLTVLNKAYHHSGSARIMDRTVRRRCGTLVLILTLISVLPRSVFEKVMNRLWSLHLEMKESEEQLTGGFKLSIGKSGNSKKRSHHPWTKAADLLRGHWSPSIDLKLTLLVEFGMCRTVFTHSAKN
jgi:hypothetical protein